MVLSVKERFLMGVLYPRESDLVTQILVKDIKSKAEISQKEMKMIDFKQVSTGFQWDVKKAKDKNVDFTEAEVNLLKEQVERLDKEKKITTELVDLCLKIKETNVSKSEK